MLHDEYIMLIYENKPSIFIFLVNKQLIY